jgi:DNA-binding transcriptional ArsR family regulator
VSLEERLERIEKMLAEVLARLARLEAMADGLGGEARVATELVMAFSAPVQEAVRLARLTVEALSRLGGRDAEDDIARAIVEALAFKGPLTLRGLEREVRRLRGRASRSAIRARLERLEEAGVVRAERRGRRMVVRLAVEDETGGPGVGDPLKGHGGPSGGARPLHRAKGEASPVEASFEVEAKEEAEGEDTEGAGRGDREGLRGGYQPPENSGGAGGPEDPRGEVG